VVDGVVEILTIGLNTSSITTEFRRALESYAAVKYPMAGWQRCDMRIAQARLQEFYDQLACFLLQSAQLPEIGRQETRETHQANHRCQNKNAKRPQDKARPVVRKIRLQECSIRKAGYRQQREQRRHRCGALHTARVTPNPRNALVQVAAFIAVVIKNEVPQKRRFCFMLAHDRYGFYLTWSD